MKRMFAFYAAALLLLPLFVCAQDPALEERLNKLDGKIEDLIAARDAQNKRIEELARSIRELQEQIARPNAAYAMQDDVKRLAESLQEVDRKRQADNDRIIKEIEQLAKTLTTSSRSKPVVPSSSADKGYEYEIQRGDTLSAIVAAYREKNIKVTVDQILQANRGLDPNRMMVGQKIFIPAPNQ